MIWVLADRTVIDTRTMLKRYPQMAQVAGPRQQWPDYEPTAGDWFFKMNRIVGALAVGPRRLNDRTRILSD
jgi:hypothetical protein